MDAKFKRYETELEWKSARYGLFTSSQIGRLMANPSKAELASGEKLSKGAKTYVNEIIRDRLGAYVDHNYENAAMRWGNECEGAAALAVANHFGVDPSSNDFIYTSMGGWVLYYTNILAGTPDVIMPDALVEIKCPDTTTWIHYATMDTTNEGLLKKELGNWYWQMQSNMLLSGKNMCYLALYDPRLIKIPKDKWLQIINIPANIEDQELIQYKVSSAWGLMLELESSILI